MSAHELADPIVNAAHEQGLTLRMPEAVDEVRGYGIQGVVGGHRVRVGKASWIMGAARPDWMTRAQRRANLEGCLAVYVAVDDEPAAALLFTDAVRSDSARMIRVLRGAGISRVVLLTGDRKSTADRVGQEVGVDEVLAECDPAAKLADVVLTADRLDVLADAMQIARRSKHIACRAVVVGMGFAVAGVIPPAAGAMGQEAIDLLAIGIAPQALLPGRQHPHLLPPDVATLRRLQQGHDRTGPVIEQLRAVADALSTTQPDLEQSRELLNLLENDLLTHERADERELVPILGRVFGRHSTPALHRGHAEIELHVAQLRTLLADVDNPTPADVEELRRVL